MNQLPWPADFGRPRTVRPANPAAGANLSVAVETNSIWLPLSIQLTIVADANIANRQIHLLISDTTSEFTRIASPNFLLAGATRQYNFGVDYGYAVPIIAANDFMPLISRYFLREGDTITTLINLIQVGDQISDVRIRILEWLHFYI